MDVPQGLFQAIKSSISEKSCKNLNDYLARSLFGAKDLNANTVAVLSTILEEGGSNEKQSLKVRCVLITLQYLLKLQLNSVFWEDLSENISKLCELCFCISVSCTSTELVNSNLKVLEQIVELNQSLKNNIFRYLLDPCLTEASVHCRSVDPPHHHLLSLLSFISSLIEHTSRMKRAEIVPTVTHHLDELSNFLTDCGDYEMQAIIVEVLARCSPFIINPAWPSHVKSEKLTIFSNSLTTGKLFSRYSFLNFDPDCRMFLNELNRQIGVKRLVYSVPCLCLIYANNTLKKPKDPHYKEFWVDFNMKSKRISFYHQPISGDQDSKWDFDYVLFEEIENVVLKDSACTSTNRNTNVECVKAEFMLSKKEMFSGQISILKLYFRKSQYDLLHNVLLDNLHDVYKYEGGLNLKAEALCDVETNSQSIHAPDQPITYICSTPSNKLLDAASNNQQVEPQKIMVSSPFIEKQTKHVSQMFVNDNFNDLGNTLCLNSEQSLRGNERYVRNTPSLENKDHKYATNDCLNQLEHTKTQRFEESQSLKEATPKPLLKSKAKDMNFSSKETKSNSIDSRRLKQISTSVDEPVKRKRLYSTGNEDVTLKSIVLTSQEDQSLEIQESLNKMPRINVNNNTNIGSFDFPNISRRKAYKKRTEPQNLLFNENNSDDSKPLSSSEETNSNTTANSSCNLFAAPSVYSDFPSETKTLKNSKVKTYARGKLNKRKRFNINVHSDSDSDYKPPNLKEVRCEIPKRRVLRNRKERVNKMVVNNKGDLIKNETIVNRITCNTDNLNIVPRRKQIDKPTFKENNRASISSTFTSKFEHDSSYSGETENPVRKTRCLRSKPEFVNTLDTNRRVEPIRDEIQADSIEVTFAQPEDCNFVPREINTNEAELETEGLVFLPTLTNMNKSIPENHRKVKSNKVTKSKLFNSPTMEADELSVSIPNESLFQDNSFTQTTFEVNDILDFGQQRVLKLQNNIKEIQFLAHEKRQQNFCDYDLKLQNTRSSILTKCEQLKVVSNNMKKVKVLLDETFDLQKNLTFQIQSDMALLEEAKEELFNNESKIKNSESCNVMDIFKSIATYVQRVLFASFPKKALTNQAEK